MLVETVIRPIPTYAAPVWCYTAPTHIKQLQTVQNIAMRRATKTQWQISNKRLHKETGMVTIAEFICSASDKLYKAASHSDNPVVQELDNNYQLEDHFKYNKPKAIMQPQT